MRRRAGVEVLVGGGGRLVRDAGGWQRRVEGTGVEDIGGVGGGHHRLLRLERWASPRTPAPGAWKGMGQVCTMPCHGL